MRKPIPYKAFHKHQEWHDECRKRFFLQRFQSGGLWAGKPYLNTKASTF